MYILFHRFSFLVTMVTVVMVFCRPGTPIIIVTIVTTVTVIPFPAGNEGICHCDFYCSHIEFRTRSKVALH